MADIVKRFEDNPLIKPEDVHPSMPNFTVECVLNPGAFRFDGKICLLMRVAENLKQEGDCITVPILREGKMTYFKIKKDDPELEATDPRKVKYKGSMYLTTISHLRLARSPDGKHFTVDEKPTLTGDGPLESYGVEDCRVINIDGEYVLTYTAVSEFGHGVGCKVTRDWRNFSNLGMVIPPPNKDAALFPDKIGGLYYMLHRPMSGLLGGNYMWIAASPDLRHWGNHMCIARTRQGSWDCERIGVAAEPIKTDQGWLVIYHAADKNSRYCLGTLLLDSNNPGHVVARCRGPFMEPISEYEQKGFFGNVVFANGQILDKDKVVLYYGASDTVICAATTSVSELLDTLG